MSPSFFLFLRFFCWWMFPEGPNSARMMQRFNSGLKGLRWSWELLISYFSFLAVFLGQKQHPYFKSSLYPCSFCVPSNNQNPLAKNPRGYTVVVSSHPIVYQKTVWNWKQRNKPKNKTSSWDFRTMDQDHHHFLPTNPPITFGIPTVQWNNAGKMGNKKKMFQGVQHEKIGPHSKTGRCFPWQSPRPLSSGRHRSVLPWYFLSTSNRVWWNCPRLCQPELNWDKIVKQTL